MEKRKRINFFLITGTILAGIFCLCGCTSLTIDSMPYSRSETEDILRESIDTNFTIIREEVLQEHPRKVKYYCMIDDRGIPFTCETGLYERKFYELTQGYERYVSTDYERVLKEQYRDARIRTGRGCPYYYAEDTEQDDFFLITKYDQIPEVAETIAAMNRVYLPEAQYHTGKEWCKTPERIRVRVSVGQRAETGDYVQIGVIDFLGLWGESLSSQEVMEQLEDGYIRSGLKYPQFDIDMSGVPEERMRQLQEDIELEEQEKDGKS